MRGCGTYVIPLNLYGTTKTQLSNSMTKVEAILHKKLIKDQLTLISLYWEDFEKRIGKVALQGLIDALLDKKLRLDKEFPNLKA